MWRGKLWFSANQNDAQTLQGMMGKQVISLWNITKTCPISDKFSFVHKIRGSLRRQNTYSPKSPNSYLYPWDKTIVFLFRGHLESLSPLLF